MKSISYKRFFNQCASESRPFEELECDVFNQVLAAYEDENSNFCVPDGIDGVILTQLIYLAILYMYNDSKKEPLTYNDYFIGDDFFVIERYVTEILDCKSENLSWYELSDDLKSIISEYDYDTCSDVSELSHIVMHSILGVPKDFS